LRPTHELGAGAPRWFTPVNEPCITAMYSALIGIWNDRRRSHADFANALCHCVLANLEAMARIRADRDGWWIGAEGFTCPMPAGPEHEPEAERIRALAWAVWDLHFGSPLAPEIAEHFAGVDDAVRSRIDALATTANTIAGHDFYPVSVHVVGGALDAWSIEDRLDAYETTASAGTNATASTSGSPRRRIWGSASIARRHGSPASRRACGACAIAAFRCEACAGTAAAISTTGTRRSASRSAA
jgi:hypothetical protein